MRCAYLFTVFFLGLSATGAALAQTSYQSSATNYGFAARPDNWQPAIGSGLASAPYPATQYSANQHGQYPLAQSSQRVAEPYPAASYPAAPTAAPQYSAPQYSAPQYSAPQYSASQYSASQNQSPQYAAPQYPGQLAASRQRSPQYSATPYATTPIEMPSEPRVRFPSWGDVAPGYDRSQLYGSASHEASILGGPAHHAPHQGAMSGAPHYSTPQQGPDAQYLPHAADGGAPKGGPNYSTPASRWFAGVYGLIMTRDQENNVWLSYDTNDIRQRVLNSRDASASYTGGVETRFGRFFGSGSSAFEVVYWGLVPTTEEANVLATDVVGDLDTILHFDGISYDPGAPQLVSTGFFQAERHRLQRDYNLHNVELNLLETNFRQICGGTPVNLTWAAGLRYVKFDESFLYSTDPVDDTFTGAADELHYAIDAKNDLFGFQVGGRADVCFKPGFTSFVDTKVGLLINRASQHSRIFNSVGPAEVSDAASPYFGTPLDIRTSKTDMAFVGELRTGLDYQFTPCWSATIGYRVIALTGVALSTNQIPVDFIGAIDSLRSVDTNGCLIAHGAFAGLEYCY